MSSLKIPSYRLHKPSGAAVVTLPDGQGGRHDIRLGEYGTSASRQEYARVIAQWEARGRQLPASAAADSGLSVNEVLLAYWQHVEVHYRLADGTPSSEVSNIRLALRPLKELFGHTPADDFDAPSLDLVRKKMIGNGRCRNRVNKDTARIKRVFKWAASQKMVDVRVCQQLATVEGLRAGRSTARETDPVLPVPRAVVEATVAVLSPTLADLVLLQLETGMRPGEACGLCGADLDRSGDVWLYRPGQHKGKHHGHQRVIALGPRAIAILKRHLKADPAACLFSPAHSMAEFRAGQRLRRRSRVQPSQRCRKKRKPRRQPRDYYTASSYANAVAAGCDKAFPPPVPLRQRPGETKAAWQARLTEDEQVELKAWQKAHRWHPHRLRHTRALELKRAHGLDVARAVLGHRTPVITEHYASLDLETVMEVARAIG
jgi:integrase